MSKKVIFSLFSISTILLINIEAFSFEDTKVLPKGIRNVTVKNIYTEIQEKTNHQGNAFAIASALEQDLSLAKVLAGESGLKKTKLQALMLAEGLSDHDSLGKFRADMNGNVLVHAPVMSYGLSEQLSLALAVPYYQANMSVSLGFQQDALVREKIISSLQSKNEITSANSLITKLNLAKSGLNQKLVANGYQSLDHWKGAGIGDVTLAGKYLAFNGEPFKLAMTNGLVLPTGRTSDPDILNDIPFGKGTLDYFANFSGDTYLSTNFFINTHAKLTHHFKSARKMRLKTESESLEVANQRVEFGLGNEIEGGLSLQFEPDFGLLAALGYVGKHKYQDRYSVDGRRDVEAMLEKNTDMRQKFYEVRLGYSGVNAFKRKEIPVPFKLVAELKKHLASTNSIASDLYTVDMAVFF